MKILRSLLAVVVGWIVAMAIIVGFEFLNFRLHLPAGETSAMEAAEKLHNDPRAMKDWIDAMPADGMFIVLAAWQLGAFIGGLISAMIAGRARVLHAGVIGVLVLAGTIYNFYDMKANYDFSHPDWMLIAGLLLPIPVSLLAGKLIAIVFPAELVNPS